MSETDPVEPLAPAAPPASPAVAPAAATARPRSGRGRAIAWLLLLAVAVIAAVLAWRQWERLQQSEQRADAWQQESAALERRILALESGLESARRAQRAIETRATDNAATNKVLREELLGMGERASLLEDAVTRLADNRVRGEMILRLNEAEFLLLLGQERLRLFGDVPAAIQAYHLTDAALAGLDDPVLATLRQTLAQELLALRSIEADPRPALRAELARLADGLARLPASRADVVTATTQSDSRLVQLLSRLVTIRRVDARDAVLGPVQRETALAALQLQLELAQAALARPDPSAYQHALNQAGAQVARLFDAEDSAVVQAQATLARLRAATLVPELPVLGATLQELRGLRAMRSVGSAEPPAPMPPAAPAAESPATPPAPAPVPTEPAPADAALLEGDE